MFVNKNISSHRLGVIYLLKYSTRKRIQYYNPPIFTAARNAVRIYVPAWNASKSSIFGWLYGGGGGDDDSGRLVSLALSLSCFISIALSLCPSLSLYHFLYPSQCIVSLAFSLSLSPCLSPSPPSVSAIIWVSRFSDYEIAHEWRPLHARVTHAQYTRPEICAICITILENI